MESTKLLLQDLFQNYSTDIRPVTDQTKSVNVDVDLDLASINDVDEVAGTISLVVILHISWNDESLAWNPTLYGNTTLLTVPQTKVWLPKLFLCNPADSFHPVSSDHFSVSIMSHGLIVWQPGALLTATCTPDVYRYPFDEQSCMVQLSPWGYSSNQVKIRIPSSKILFTFYVMNSEWDVIDSRTSHWSRSFDIAHYFVDIRRRHMNFVVSVVVPVILLAYVNLFVFILPFDSGERTSYSITVLLAFTVYMTVVSDKMPASSQPMSYISYYLLSLVGISVVIVTVNIFQIRIYSKHDEDGPVPIWIKKACLYSRNVFKRTKVNTKGNEDRPTGTATDTGRIQVMDSECLKVSDDLFSAVKLVSKEKSATNTLPTIPPEEPGLVTWHMAARFLDKAYFSLFLLLNLLTTVSYFITVNVK
ncbi:acetylcholine receptor subunit alpha-like [Argopecten irradians]|uniref:acetylcholine receptor subunit alpha-like n=1 Tax=Argopecten irradians TaxID=31199 RepID=UPI003714EC8C